MRNKRARDLEALLDQVEWVAYDGPAGAGSPLHATHKSCICVEDVQIACYQLQDGRRIFDAEDVLNLVLSRK
jgi:hypothetical protein